MPAASPVLTGARAVPGAVEPHLWHEHKSRYCFASLFAERKNVLDLGCGTGYGAALLAEKASCVTGIDVSAETIAFASSRYFKPKFLTGSATEVPFRAGLFGLVTAFELIEHLNDWTPLLTEVSRVLAPDGVFVVSTPNRIADGQARGDAGPNPLHVRSFELEEFREALAGHFRFVRILSQSHQTAWTFSDGVTADVEAHLPSAAASSERHSFVAICAQRKLEMPFFVFAPAASNPLHERDCRIQALQAAVRDSRGQLDLLLETHRELQRELDANNAWALSLEKEIRQGRGQIASHERGLAAAGAALQSRQAELQAAHARLQKTDEELLRTQTDLSRLQTVLKDARADLAKERAVSNAFEVRLQAAQEHNDKLVAEIEQVQESAWIRLGRVLRVGPYTHRRLRISLVDAFLRRQAELLGRSVKSVAVALTAFLALLAAAVALCALDVLFVLFGKRRNSIHGAPSHESASIVIPNWNGRDLLARSLEPLLAAVDVNLGNEIIVVDNASTDDSVAFLREHFPQVRIHQLSENMGFAGGANAGVRAAKNEIVVLLNNDMHVQPGFLSPLLEHFADPLLFAVSSQIFFSDSARVREETGLTETWWDKGVLRVGHRIDADVNVAYPCAYPGGGSSAFDRRKFLELGGFDALFHPFYYEDTDLGRLAWKRGWKVLYEPSSAVFHEHRGTIGKNFSRTFIENTVRKNAILYCWKNVHDWRMLLAHFGVSLRGSPNKASVRSGAAPYSCSDILRATRQLPSACHSRWRALSFKAVSDREAFRRPLGGFFRDRFVAPSAPIPERLNVLFVSPYPIEPPIHGGAVFMKETLAQLSELADVHLLSFLDTKEQLADNRGLSKLCKTAQFMVRPRFAINEVWTLTPVAIREFRVREFAWLIHRSMYLLNIDVLQLEYTIMGQYGEDFRHIASFLFEHDISVQSLGRRLRAGRFNFDLFLEYVRMRLYEPRLLSRFHRVQVCSEENASYLHKLQMSLRSRVDANVRAAINIRQYDFVSSAREPDTILFVGSFRHSLNVEALQWFTREVLPVIIKARPSVTLYIVGSSPPTSSTIWNDHPNIRLLGAVPDIKACLQRFSVFICPILSGSGVRVKLLEAFASGIPSVSTTVGAEGLAQRPGEVCALADSPHDFASAVLSLLDDPDAAAALAARARLMVERQRDSRVATRRLESIYRSELQVRRRSHVSQISGPDALRGSSPAYSLAEKGKY